MQQSEAVFTPCMTSDDSAGCLDARCRTTSATPDDVIRSDRPMSSDVIWKLLHANCRAVWVLHDVTRHRSTSCNNWRKNWTCCVIGSVIESMCSITVTSDDTNVVRCVNTAWDDYDLLTIMTLYRAAIQCPQRWHTTLPGLHFTAPVHCRDCTQTTVGRISLSSLFT